MEPVATATPTAQGCLVRDGRDEMFHQVDIVVSRPRLRISKRPGAVLSVETGRRVGVAIVVFVLPLDGDGALPEYHSVDQDLLVVSKTHSTGHHGVDQAQLLDAGLVECVGAVDPE